MDTSAPREAAGLGKAVRMRRVGEAQDGMADRAALPVDALQPVTLHVRTLDGILVRTLDVQTGTHSHPLPQGVYLVETEKIVIN